MAMSGLLAPSPYPPVSLAHLTQKERLVLDLIMQGRSKRKIANRLRITERSLEVHRVRIMEKLAVKRSFQLFRTVTMLRGEYREELVEGGVYINFREVLPAGFGDPEV
jgi:DNA-binding NarL/FixJ family response regulator